MYTGVPMDMFSTTKREYESISLAKISSNGADTITIGLHPRHYSSRLRVGLSGKYFNRDGRLRDNRRKNLIGTYSDTAGTPNENSRPRSGPPIFRSQFMGARLSVHLV